MVLLVDKEKGYIDLSKRRVNPEDVAGCEERFSKSKMVHSIMRHVAETTGQDVEDLYKCIAWPLYKAYGHAFDAFKVEQPPPCCLCIATMHTATVIAHCAKSSQDLPAGQCCCIGEGNSTLSWTSALMAASVLQLRSIPAVQTMVSDSDAVLLKLQNDFNDGKPIEVLTEGVREAIIKNVKRRMTPQPLKIRADVELTCFSYDGVLHIQVRHRGLGRRPP